MRITHKVKLKALMKPPYNSIGIWGFSIVGKSVLSHIHQHAEKIGICDKRILSPQEQELIHNHQATMYHPDMLQQFLEEYDVIVPSPGVPLHEYTKYAHKWLSELDLFAAAWHKPVIAITGTVGKTTTASLIAHTLKSYGRAVGLGGNIGNPMLDLIAQENMYELAVLELSSFQLMHMKHFTPTIAVLLNLYPNHLDHHTSFNEYRDAKYNLFRNQTEQHHALIPYTLHTDLQKIRPSKTWVAAQQPLNVQVQESIFYHDHDWILKYEIEHNERVIRLTDATKITVVENLVFITALLEHMGIRAEHLSSACTTFPVQEHRMELVLEHNGVSIYNDSKATLPEATLAALERLGTRPSIVIIGGLSKGVDRSFFFQRLPSSVQHIICFGKEAEKLYQLGILYQHSCYISPSLEDAIAQARTLAQPGSAVLFSPGGSSFDLFTDYKERGTCFKNHILNQWRKECKQNMPKAS